MPWTWALSDGSKAVEENVQGGVQVHVQVNVNVGDVSGSRGPARPRFLSRWQPAAEKLFGFRAFAKLASDPSSGTAKVKREELIIRLILGAGWKDPQDLVCSELVTIVQLPVRIVSWRTCPTVVHRRSHNLMWSW